MERAGTGACLTERTVIEYGQSSRRAFWAHRELSFAPRTGQGTLPAVLVLLAVLILILVLILVAVLILLIVLILVLVVLVLILVLVLHGNYLPFVLDSR